MKRIFLLSLMVVIGCAKHESTNKIFRKPGDEFVGVKPTDPPGLMQEAIANDDLNKVTELLSKDFDLNSTLPNKRTPLIHATRESKYRIMNEFIKRGADALLRDGEGLTALDWALRNAGTDDDGKQIINRGVILLSPDAQVSQRKELLKFAGRGSTAPIIRLLQEVGVDPNFVGDGGDTPLTLAIRKQKALAVGVLSGWQDCPGGASSSNCLKLTAIDLDLPGADGVKPLTLAKQMANANIVDILTKAGAKE